MNPEPGMPSLLSVNIGRPERQAGVANPTGINKSAQSAPVDIGPLGLLGDAVMDTRVHGGPDQAVYIYFADDYAWWTAQLGEALAPGMFGDNLTIGGIVGQSVAIGDRFAIRSVVLEVTMHRTPCNTLARQMRDPGFVRRFHKALRPGAYARVLAPGQVAAGDSVTHTPFAGERVLLTELMALDGARDIPETVMRRAIATPVHRKLRAAYEARLADAG